MKKILSCFAVLALALVSLLGLASCGESNGVEKYVVEAKFNSEEVNQWKTLYLIDEDNYVITVYALDSKDMETVTADFYMAGTYTREGNVVTIELGYGYCKAVNGGIPMEFAITPLTGGAMYAAMMGSAGTVYTLANGSFTVSE